MQASLFTKNKNSFPSHSLSLYKNSWSCQFIDLTPSSSSQSSTLSIYYETWIPYISHHVTNELKKESPIRLARKMALKSIAWSWKVAWWDKVSLENEQTGQRYQGSGWEGI